MFTEPHRTLLIRPEARAYREGAHMRRRFALGFASVALAVVGIAGPVAAATDNPNACFGQDRAAGVHAISGRTWGDIASDRKGTNAQHNAAYRATCS
jgi:hypothetical protein